MKKMAKVTSVFCAAMLCATALASCELLLPITPPGNSGDSSSSEPSTSGVQSTAVSYVSVDINPSIELTLDGENKVVSVYGSNEDGRVLLYEEEGIVGADVEAALEKITALAVELGYLDEDNKVVTTNVAGEGAETLLGKVNAKVTAVAQELGVTVTTDGEGAYSLLRDLEQFKAAYPDNAAIQNISVSDFKLALIASETGEVTLEVAVTMDTDELVALVSNAHTQIEAFATEAYELAKMEANALYTKAFGMAKASVYMEYTAQNLNLLNPLPLGYASAYFMYEASACGFEASADALACVERLYHYELSETQVQAVLSALQLEDTAENRALLKNSEGEITVDSVEAYADKLFKNTPASEQLEEAKEALDSALIEAEALANQAIAEAKATYGPQIKDIISRAKGGLTYISMVKDFLPALLKQSIEDFEEIAADVEAVIDTNEFGEGTLRQLAKEMNEKSDAILAELQSKLTDADKQAIEAKIAELETQYADDKQAMEEKIAQAEEDAKARLEELKNARNAEE